MVHKIMVVDDDAATRRAVRDALQRNGHEVIEAPDGKTARAMMTRWHPRVVLQDLMLPDADGFTLVGELRKLAGTSDVAILAFSGSLSELREPRISTVDFDDIIAKPIAPSLLVPIIEAHLPRAAVTREDRHGPIEIEQVMDAALGMAWTELRHRARVVKEYGHVPPVEANASRLGQVFLDLLINAAHAIPDGNYDANEIRIATAYRDGKVIVSVSDTGSGIPLEVRARLFTPVVTTKPAGEGTGRGLAVALEIVTELGGAITFATELGRGTQFQVTLPASAT